MSQPDPNFDPNQNKRTIMVDGQPVDLDTFMQMQSGVGGPIPVPKRRRSGGCGIGLIILALVIVVPLILIFVFAGNVLNSVTSSFGGIGNMVATVSSAIQPPETQAIVSGDPAQFDPLVGLAQAQEFAGDNARLATITATYIRADGTMDLTATYSPAPRTEYTFLREIPRPTDAPPVGVAGSGSGPWYEPINIEAYRPGQVSRVTSTGGSVSTQYTYTNQGMLKKIEDPTTNPFDDIAPEPECNFVDLWETAIKEGASEEAVAIIEYNADGYSFVISGDISLEFDMDCKLIE